MNLEENTNVPTLDGQDDALMESISSTDSVVLKDLCMMEDYCARRLFLNDEITPESVEDIIKAIIRFNANDYGQDLGDRDPIYLYITSNGGDEDAAFELIDIVQSSETPVVTINMGYQYSAGFLIGLAGDCRVATKNAKFLMHASEIEVSDSEANICALMEFREKARQRTKDYVLSVSDLTEEEYDQKIQTDWFMFADEAKDHGFVDYILGVDIKLDEVA